MRQLIALLTAGFMMAMVGSVTSIFNTLSPTGCRSA